MRRMALIAGAVACVGCQRVEREPYADDALPMMMVKPPPGVSARAPIVNDVAAAPAADAAAAPPAGPVLYTPVDASSAPRVAAGPPMLAYSYSYGLSLPGSRIDALRRAHERACVKAGYRVCQVVSSEVRDYGSGRTSGVLAMRAAPSWLQPFRDGLAGAAKDAGGRIETSEVSSEDLSREIVDTEAQLRAKTALRDRLQALLANRPGKLADLLAVERELARVQGEIDSTTSQLAVMRARVAMSDITLTYSPNDVIGAGVRSPLRSAFGGFFANAAASLAAIVEGSAVALPWLVLLAALGWLFRKPLAALRRRLWGARAANAGETSTAPARPAG